MYYYFTWLTDLDNGTGFASLRCQCARMIMTVSPKLTTDVACTVVYAARFQRDDEVPRTVPLS